MPPPPHSKTNTPSINKTHTPHFRRFLRGLHRILLRLRLLLPTRLRPRLARRGLLLLSHARLAHNDRLRHQRSRSRSQRGSILKTKVQIIVCVSLLASRAYFHNVSPFKRIRCRTQILYLFAHRNATFHAFQSRRSLTDAAIQGVSIRLMLMPSESRTLR